MTIVSAELIVDCITRYVGTYYKFDYSDHMSKALRDSLSRGQLLSKLSITSLASRQIPQPVTGFFIGHWHGLLPRLFYKAGIVNRAQGVELDSVWVNFSQELNHDWNWSSQTADVNHVCWPSDCHLVVNTSCEHMDDSWIGQVGPGMLVCAQSTDYVLPEHINSVSSLDEFVGKFSGYEILESHQQFYDIYSRYSIVARKL